MYLPAHGSLSSSTSTPGYMPESCTGICGQCYGFLVSLPIPLCCIIGLLRRGSAGGWIQPRGFTTEAPLSHSLPLPLRVCMSVCRCECCLGLRVSLVTLLPLITDQQCVCRCECCLGLCGHCAGILAVPSHSSWLCYLHVRVCSGGDGRLCRHCSQRRCQVSHNMFLLSACAVPSVC